jgi:hypothetical protein
VKSALAGETSRPRCSDNVASDQIVAQMADDLIHHQALGGEHDAIRLLMDHGRFWYGDIASHAGEALAEAQRRVARARRA